MHYTLNQLEVFVKVVELQSVTKAAEALHLSQPAVSIQLKNFQEQFDIPLTEVVGRKIYITEFGYEIAAAAESILLEVSKINIKAKAFKGLLTGKIKIAIKSTGKYVMPYFLSGFANTHKEVEIRMDVTNRSQVLESLENNAIDFALISIVPENLQIEKISLLPNKLFLIGKTSDHLSETDDISKILKETPFIFREKGSGTRFMIENFFTSNSLKVSKRFELTSNEAVKQAILAGLGCSIMPLIGIKNELMKGELEIIPIDELPIITQWRLIWLKGKKLSPAALAFVDYLTKEKQNIIKQQFSWCDLYT
jgi:DNA-binding transcriptional LysR family regulator